SAARCQPRPQDNRQNQMAGRSGFAAFVSGRQLTTVPQIILQMRGAKPALALVAEVFSRLIARLV
ncbi:MAG TPA: hypothetical protein VH114_10675, partial [Candidatus Acidoferrum sp.]|nr:hypothetical protein [Candidatus Acidoferrum sp.]